MWKSFALALVAVCALCCSPSCADEIVVSTDGSTARRISVRVENGSRGLFGRMFNRRGGATGAGSAATAPAVSPAAPSAVPAGPPLMVLPVVPAKTASRTAEAAPAPAEPTRTRIVIEKN